MKVIKAILANLCVSLSIACGVICIVDTYNPHAGILQSEPAKILLLALCILSIIVSLTFFVSKR